MNRALSTTVAAVIVSRPHLKAAPATTLRSRGSVDVDYFDRDHRRTAAAATLLAAAGKQGRGCRPGRSRKRAPRDRECTVPLVPGGHGSSP